MTMLTVVLGEHDVDVDLDGLTRRLPVGISGLLATALQTDPPLPEELTNALGTVIDHIDDVVREVPDVFDHEVAARGVLVGVVADVEAGTACPLPHRVGRDELEELFRTLATEPARDRRLNPGLPSDEVDRIVAACCILVAFARRLHLDHLVLSS
jgi:exopolyphosphatase / guanosine-5'-triphosphate,3'-diphosphate pyrophosphatase